MTTSGSLPQSSKEGWTDRCQRKPQAAEIKGCTDQRQTEKELVSVTGIGGLWLAKSSPAHVEPRAIPGQRL